MRLREAVVDLSSYQPSFFQKLALCRGLQFSIPRFISPFDIKASFERAYWQIEPKLYTDNQKKLTAVTLRSIATDYIQYKGPQPPEALQKAIKELRKRDDIVISIPDKGSGVVIMDKEQYTSLLKDASVNDHTKFKDVLLERPKSKGRPPKHYHPLLLKEKTISSVIRRILPKSVADTVCPNGSRLAHPM